MNIDLTGRRALVCGASKGIGRATALELKKLGAEVLAVARSEDSLKSLDTEYLACDFSDAESRKKLLSFVEGQEFHILVCNSGGPPGGPLHQAKVVEFENAFYQHLFLNHELLQNLLPSMKKSGYGRVINILSTSVKAPIPNLGVSNTLRAAVANWAKTLSQELGPFGITVNNVLPGFTSTDRLDILKQKTAGRLEKSTEDVESLWLSTIPAGRFGEPSELAEAVAFLASPSASYINGINLPVDGGRLGSL